MSCLVPSRSWSLVTASTEHVGVEHVVAHRREHLVGGVRKTLGVLGLLEELADLAPVGVVDLDDPELVGERDRLPDRGDRHAGTGLLVLLDHLREVHAIDVVRLRRRRRCRGARRG
jgi:hypothetical protein